MADLLRTGSDFLQDMQKTHVSQLVTYERGAYSVDVYATVATKPRETLDAAGQVVIADQTDFLIHTADLILNSVAVLPARGDTITDQNGDEWQVLPAVAGEDHWRYSDAYKRRLRIHAKRVA